MDFNDIKNQVSNLTLYDIKAGWRKAQNAVMNYTEMEAKVREATNNEPWGSSSSIMQEIANGTFNYSALSEIMPMIYKRFTEKSAEEWRQIYKALQLLEFLIKNGSERVVDDARSHLSLLKMLRQFHFIDQNGKDQGINVRNRAKELADLLGDVDRIRNERKKARTTRNKYTGAEGGMGLGGGLSSGSRYGGFGGESGGTGATNFGGYSGGVYGDGGGFGGRTEVDEYDAGQARRERFEEYDEYDEGGATSTTGQRRTNRTSTAAPKQPPKPKEPEVDLFDFGDDDAVLAAPPVAPTSNGKAQAAPLASADDFGAMQASGGDDDFDDFQAAPAASSAVPSLPPSQPTIQPSNGAGGFPVLSQPTSTANTRSSSAANYGAFKAPTSTAPPAAAAAAPTLQPMNQTKPTNFQPQGPNYFGSISTAPSASGASTPSGVTSPSATSKPAGGLGAPAKKPASSGDPFASLAIGGGKKTTSSSKGPTMADMAKQKASQGIWGAPAQPQQGGGSSGDLI